MCYSATTSLQTYAMAMVGFLLGWVYGFSRPALWFAFLFSQMQLVEYFLWKNLKDPTLNRLFSALGLFVIFLEPIFALRLSGPNLSWIMAYLVLIGASYFLSPPFDLSTQIGKDGHLHWNFLQPIESPMAWVWIAFFAYGIFRTYNRWGYLFALVTLLYAFYRTALQRTWSSYWCFVVNLFWLYVIAWVLYRIL